MTSTTDIPFFLSSEQIEFRDTLDRMLREKWPLEQRRGGEWSAEALWRDLAEFGALALPFDEKHGGLNGGALDTMLVASLFGRHLVRLPFVPSIAAVAILLGEGGNADIASIAAGTRDCAVVIDLDEDDPLFADCARTQNGYRLDGKSLPLIGRTGAQKLIVPARHGDQAGGISLFIVPANADGVTILRDTVLDGTALQRIDLSDVAVQPDARVGTEGGMAAAFDKAADMIRLGYAAEAVGIAKALLDRTVDYVKVRKQFGVTIGSFQAIQHRLVEMFAAVEVGEAQVQAAFAQFAIAKPEERRRLAITTKMHVDKAALHVAREAVQLHGGMGLTAELDIGDFFKRLLVIRHADGGPRLHRSYILQESGDLSKR